MTSRSTTSWYILRFEEDSGAKQQTKDILYMSDPQKPITTAAQSLESTLFERFDRLGDYENGDSFRLKRFAIVNASTGQEIEITTQQLVTYLRDIPHQPTAQTPDLFGFGTNKIKVGFEYVEVAF